MQYLRLKLIKVEIIKINRICFNLKKKKKKNPEFYLSVATTFGLSDNIAL